MDRGQRTFFPTLGRTQHRYRTLCRTGATGDPLCGRQLRHAGTAFQLLQPYFGSGLGTAVSAARVFYRSRPQRRFASAHAPAVDRRDPAVPAAGVSAISSPPAARYTPASVLAPHTACALASRPHFTAARRRDNADRHNAAEP